MGKKVVGKGVVGGQSVVLRQNAGGPHLQK